MELLVYIKTSYNEYTYFAIIREDLLDDLQYLLKHAYNNSEIGFQVDYSKVKNINLPSNYFFRGQLEDLCLSNDDSDFEEAYRVKKALIRLAEYYNIDCYYNFEKLCYRD